MGVRQRIGMALRALVGRDRVPLSPGVQYSGVLGLANRQASPEEMARQYRGWVYKAVNRRAQDIGMVEQYAVARVADDKYQRLPRKHPLQRLLQRPNPFMTMRMLRQVAQMHLDLLGNAYLWQARNSFGLTAEIWPLDARYVTVVPDREQVIGGYLYRIDGQTYRIPAADIIHVKYPNPESFYYGLSPLTAAAWDVDIDRRAKEHQERFLRLNPVPRIGVESPGFLLPADADLIRARIMSTLSDPSLAGAPLISHSGAKIQALDLSPAEIDYLSTRKNARDEILTVYGVPASVLGIAEDVNRANAEAAHYSYALRVIEPNMVLWDDVLTLELAEEFDSNYVIQHVNSIPEDRAAAREDMKARISARITSTNEERELLGRPPVTGGDEPLAEVNLMPLSAVGQVDLANEQDPPELHAPAHTQRGSAQRGPAQRSSAQRAAGADEWTETRRLAYWRTLAAQQITHERRIARRLREVYARQAKAVLAAIGADRTAADYAQRRVETRSLDLDAVILTMDEFTSEFERLGLAEVELTMRDAWKLAMLEIARQTPWSYTSADVARMMRETIAKIKDSNDTTRDRLVDTLREGLDSNDDLDALAGRVLDTFRDASIVRAKRIALTTATQATNAGRDAAWLSERDLVRGGMWVSSRDGKSRGAHQDADGQKRQMGKTYIVGGEALRYPGDPKGSAKNVINCRCFEAPLLDEVS